MIGLTCFAVFALFGFLSPSNRGSIGTVAVLLYTILGCVGGYVSARVYKTFGGDSWKQNIALTPILIPGIVFGTFFLLNLFLWAKQSSGAVPFSTMLVIVAIWFIITVPLSFAGSWLGLKQPVSSSPSRHLGRLLTSNSAGTSACSHKSDPSPDSTVGGLPTPHTIHAACRHPALRSHLR